MRYPRATRALLIGVLSAAVCGNAGCNIIGYFGYLISPGDYGKKVAPEFSKLDGKTVAILIVADDEYVKSYDYFREQLSMVIARELKNHLDDVKTIDTFRVVGFQKAHPDWHAMEQNKLASTFGADYLLVVTVRDYGLRLPGSTNLYRARVTGDAELFDAGRPLATSRVLWSPEMSVAYPEDDRPLTRAGAAEIGQLRREIETRFAIALVNKFRTHHVKTKEGQKDDL